MGGRGEGGGRKGGGRGEEGGREGEGRGKGGGRKGGGRGEGRENRGGKQLYRRANIHVQVGQIIFCEDGRWLSILP